MSSQRGDSPDSSALERRASDLVDELLRVGVNGAGPWSGARDVAESVVGRSSSLEAAVRRLIRVHVQLAGAQGFFTNVGGLITLPVALPANVGASYLVQTRLSAGIAHVHGHDLESEEVRTMLILCLLGNSANQAVKKVGVDIGTRLAHTGIRRLPIQTVRAINRRAGFMLLTKYGTKRGAVVLSKGVPVLGGVVGGGIDAAATAGVGRFADRTFRPEGEPVEKDLSGDQ